ncbi:phosphate signaling complex protein PhoU [Syntrophomonas erecta]
MVGEGLKPELDNLKEEILKMGRFLEDQIYNAVKALVRKDAQLAQKVINNDEIIDQMELDIEKKSLGILALKQPMASDLRLVGTSLRIIIDLERMADHAENIARVAIDLHTQTYIKPLIDIPRMAKLAQKMIESALNAFIDEDISMAMEIIPLEIEMDALHDQVFRELLSYMMQDPRTIPQATALLLVGGHLERIGDHATNLAEMVIYIARGTRIDLNEMARNQE